MCAKVRALFAKNKVRFARAEQLWLLSCPKPDYFRLVRIKKVKLCSG